MLVHQHLGENLGDGQLVLGQGVEQVALNAAADVHRVDHHHVPVAGLGLLDDGEAGTRALELLDVDLDAGGVLEGLQQVRVGMIAPDEGIQIRGGGGGVRPHEGHGCNGSAEKPARETVDGHFGVSPCIWKN